MIFSASSRSDARLNWLWHLQGRSAVEYQVLLKEPPNFLLERDYEAVVVVKLSKFLEEMLDSKKVLDNIGDGGKSQRFNRYRRLQEAGKELRKKSENPSILAEYAIKVIRLDRDARAEAKRGENGEAQISVDEQVIPSKVAYLIDQIKRPEEVALLRAVYRNMFYLVGVTRIEEKRVAELERETMQQEEIHELMSIDRNEDDKAGQQLDKALHLADFFIRNDSTTVAETSTKLRRVLALIHGDKTITPTDVEQGMFAAFAAGLQSACLSRQVGAAISTKDGSIVATGCNDVPRPGGGLYTPSSDPDFRCVNHQSQHCFNDFYKRKLQKEIGDVIGRVLKDKLTDKEKASVLILDRTAQFA